MIRKKFSFWERVIKNFSLNYIGNGKILYYYKNSRDRRITYGKVDLHSRKTRFFVTSFASIALSLVIVFNNFFGSPAPAIPPSSPQKLQRLMQENNLFNNLESQANIKKEGPFSPIKKDSLAKIHRLNSVKELLSGIKGPDDQDKRLDSSFQWIGESQKWQNQFKGSNSQKRLQYVAGVDKNNLFQKALDEALLTGNEESYKKFSTSGKENLDKIKKIKSKGKVLATSVEDFETITLKNAAMMSNNLNYTPESNKQKVKIYHYSVKKGDSVGGIARKFGVSSSTIGGSSKKIFNLDEIWVGMKLRIPSKDGILKKIRRGESLAMMANRYRISLDKIIRLNGFEDPDNIPVGSYVFLPNVKPKNLFSGFLWPVRGRITSWYGWRRHPVLRRRHLHEGLDMRARYVRLRAAKSGKVVYAGWMGAYGKVVIIAHPGNYKTLYAHNSRLYVRVGQYVRQGQWIARSGNTGVSTGPHVHFEIWRNNRHINPRRLMRKRGYW